MLTGPSELQSNLRHAVLNTAGALRIDYLCGGYDDRTARLVLLLDRIRVRFTRRTGVVVDIDDTADARLYGAELTMVIAAKVRGRMAHCGASPRQCDTAEVAQDGLSAVITWAD